MKIPKAPPEQITEQARLNQKLAEEHGATMIEIPPESLEQKAERVKADQKLSAEIEAYRERVREKNAARKRSDSNGYAMSFARVLLPEMKDGVIYTNEDLGAIAEYHGLNSAGVGPATTWMVEVGFLKRVGRGKYVKLKNY